MIETDSSLSATFSQCEDYVFVYTYGRKEYDRVHNELFDRFTDGEFCTLTSGPTYIADTEWHWVKATWCGRCFGGIRQSSRLAALLHGHGPGS